MSTGSKTIRITESTLKSLKAQDKAWFIRDSEQKGFQIKILPSGQASYFVEARIGGTGNVKKFKVGNVGDLTLAEARDSARYHLGQIRSGINPQAEKRAQIHEGMTLEALLDKYLSRPRAQSYKARTIEDYRRYIDKHFKSWKKRRVVDITKYEVMDWYHGGSKTPTETDNAFRYLNALLNYAVGIEVIDLNPCDILIKRKERYTRKPRTRHLELEHDLGKFLKAFIEYDYQKDSQKTARDLILLLITTGLRFDEASKITFSNVDFEKKRLHVPDTKNRRDHIAPLVPLTYTMFKHRREHHKEQGSDYVFRIKGGKTKSPYVTDIRKTLTGICDAAGVPYVSPHDLRRTFSSALNDISVGFIDVKALMNHSDKDVTIMYVQNNIAKLRQYMVDIVRYYDHKIEFPDNPAKGWSKAATHIIQSALYGNIQPEFDPINPNEHNADHESDQEREYWDGI